MGTPKRVQASLSSFFKPKAKAIKVSTQEARDEHAKSTDSQDTRGSQIVSADTRKRRRTVSHNRDESEDESRDETAPKVHKGANDQAQILPESVSDTTDLMQQLRMRAQETGAVVPNLQVTPVLAMPGSLEGTHVQLVERTPGVKYTPLETQVLDAKKLHPDMLLAVEVGYKFRFFGEDARIASRVLGIMCTTANNFYNASIPTPRLHIHMRRLVHAGYKVGVLRQVETAALKAISDNKSAPFTRQLSEVYTSGTMVEDIGADANDRFMMSVVETARADRCVLAVVAVQVATGSVVYDEFEDGVLRSELDTRLVHLQPKEILVPPGLSTETLRALAAYVGYAIDYTERPEPLLEHANRAGVRIAFANSALLDAEAARSFSTTFYADNEAQAHLSRVLDLPETVIAAQALLADYLKPFNLDRALLAIHPFTPFHTQLHMLLSSTALQTLNVFADHAGDSNDAQLKELLMPDSRSGGNSTQCGNGSLFGVMDCTRSLFGRRLLRRWIAQPLVVIDKLRDRVDAVEYLKTVLDAESGDEDYTKSAIRGVYDKLGQLVDLERGLCRIHYGRATPQELLRVLRSLESAMALVPRDLDICEPRMLANALSAETWSSDLRTTLSSWLHQINVSSAKRGDKESLFTHGPLFDTMQTHHKRVATVEQLLDDHVFEVRQLLNDNEFAFKSISGTDYLIDVKNTKAKTVPATWIRVSSTKTNTRFHTPFIVEQLAERERCRESLQQAARSSYTLFLRTISDEYTRVRRVISALATLDALFSLAVLAGRPGYSRAELVDSDEPCIDVENAVNPILDNAEFVANTVHLGTDARAMVLTGPNAGGKSTLIRTVALIAIMAQCGSRVPAQRARLGVVDAIFTRMGARDNMLAGQSTFMVEMRETSDILHHATCRSLVVLDELGRGTSTHDGAAIAFAVLDFLVTRRALTLFVTHYGHLVDAFAGNTRVRSCHMSYLESVKTLGACVAEITFLYKLVDGASGDSFGLNVARLAGLPASLLKCAMERAHSMRVDVDSKWAAHCARCLQHAVAQFCK
ncbi:Mismatch repair protein msh3 [Coemansia sp. RSA 1199]|nr:Mismatch repair protein msh3 [Coemansia sp. RSA 1199]